MEHGQDDSDHGNKRANLDHGPRRPVDGDEVLAITKLQRQQGIRLHDNNNRRHNNAAKT